MTPPAAEIQSHIMAYLNVVILWLAIIAFVLFAGADFGAGIWNLFAFGAQAQRQRQALDNVIGPIWEANEIWSVFLVTGLFSAFPSVFYTLAVGLFYPITIALLGFVFRGAAFEYYRHSHAVITLTRGWQRAFVAASLLTPFLLGAAAGAVASGDLHYVNGRVTSSYLTPWVSPFALCCGAFSISVSAVLAATYMTVQAERNQQRDLLRAFRLRGLIAGAVMAVLGSTAALLASRYAPYLWSNLIGRALPFAIAATLAGLLTGALLVIERYRLARVMVAVTIILILGAWGIAQFPYLIPTDLSVAGAASPPQVQLFVFITAVVGLIVVLPALAYLLYVFQGGARPPAVSAEQYALAAGQSAFDLNAIFGVAPARPAGSPGPVERAIERRAGAVEVALFETIPLSRGRAQPRAGAGTQLALVLLALVVTLAEPLWPVARARFARRRRDRAR